MKQVNLTHYLAAPQAAPRPGKVKFTQEECLDARIITGRLSAANLAWIERQAAALPPFPRLLFFIVLCEVRLLRAARHPQRN